MKWFARGKLWESPEAERAAQQKPAFTEKRGHDWRPGGLHKDPRARFDKRKRTEHPPRDRKPGAEGERPAPPAFVRPPGETRREPPRRPQSGGDRPAYSKSGDRRRELPKYPRAPSMPPRREDSRSRYPKSGNPKGGPSLPPRREGDRSAPPKSGELRRELPKPPAREGDRPAPPVYRKPAFRPGDSKAASKPAAKSSARRTRVRGRAVQGPPDQDLRVRDTTGGNDRPSSVSSSPSRVSPSSRCSPCSGSPPGRTPGSRRARVSRSSSRCSTRWQPSTPRAFYPSPPRDRLAAADGG